MGCTTVYTRHSLSKRAREIFLFLYKKTNPEDFYLSRCKNTDTNKKSLCKNTDTNKKSLCKDTDKRKRKDQKGRIKREGSKGNRRFPLPLINCPVRKNVRLHRKRPAHINVRTHLGTPRHIERVISIHCVCS